jgi:hypothetical protein
MYVGLALRPGPGRQDRRWRGSPPALMLCSVVLCCVVVLPLPASAPRPSCQGSATSCCCPFFFFRSAPHAPDPPVAVGWRLFFFFPIVSEC